MHDWGHMENENPDSLAWFCVRTQPKHEHIAAAHLQLIDSMEVYCPRIRFKRPTVRGPKWFVEALFPGYLFARFCLAAHSIRVQYSPGVTSILQFGRRHARLENEIIDGIRQWIECGQVPSKQKDARVGDKVEIADGALRGLEAVITQALPGKERVRVLVEFLGRQVEAEIAHPSVMALSG